MIVIIVIRIFQVISRLGISFPEQNKYKMVLTALRRRRWRRRRWWWRRKFDEDHIDDKVMIRLLILIITISHTTTMLVISASIHLRPAILSPVLQASMHSQWVLADTSRDPFYLQWLDMHGDLSCIWGARMMFPFFSAFVPLFLFFFFRLISI